jgi:ABC-type dipeptide/oligopeptide/nickel transport system ATPase subunit
MIEMEDIRKIYRTQHVETHALTNFTITIDAGEFVSVMGPSGSVHPRRRGRQPTFRPPDVGVS